MKLEGVFTALITPFIKGEVDYAGLRENIRSQLKGGVAGIVPAGTTGETPTLTEKEYENIISLSVEEASGKAFILVGTGSNSTAHTITNTSKAKELGADAALIVTPYYNKPTQSGIIAHFQAITQAVDLPVVVYNIPGRSATNITTDTMCELSKLPNIIGVKEASGDLGQVGDVIDRIQSQNDNFSVVSGDDGLTLAMLALGARGVISVTSNILPAEMVSLVKAGLEGNFDDARSLHFKLLQIFKVLFVETSPMPVKEAMSILGLPAGDCRLPLNKVSAESHDKIRAVLRDLELI